jgi:hypothetical protein
MIKRITVLLCLLALMAACWFAAGCRDLTAPLSSGEGDLGLVGPVVTSTIAATPDSNSADAEGYPSNAEVEEALKNISGSWILSDLVGCWYCPPGYPGWDGGTATSPIIVVFGADGRFAGEGMGYNITGSGDSVRGIWRANENDIWWYSEETWEAPGYTLDGDTLSTSLFFAGPTLDFKRVKVVGLPAGAGLEPRDDNSGTPTIEDLTRRGVDRALVGVWYGETNGFGETLTFDIEGWVYDQAGGNDWDTAADEIGSILIVSGIAEPLCYRYTVEGDVLTMPSLSAGLPDGPVVTYRKVGLGGDKRLLGGWSYEVRDDEGKGYGYVSFEADGTVVVGSGYEYLDPEQGEEGDAVEGYWRTESSRLWLELGGEWFQTPYTVKGGTLQMSTFPGDPMETYHRD